MTSMSLTLRAFAAAAALEGGALLAQENYDTPPRPITMTQPVYPEGAKRDRIEGTVVLEIVIDTNGDVQGPRVLQSVAGLDEAARACVREWKFEPALEGGVPVSSVARAPITFRLSNQEE